MKEKIVYAYVVGDLLHIGHLHALENAKKLLDSDPKKYHKALQELLSASGSSENIDGNFI